MIKRSLNQNYRAAALVCAAVVLSAISAASTQAQGLTNLFGGSSGSTTLTGTPATLGLGTPAMNVTTGSLGSAYTGTVTVNNGVGSTISETLNTTTSTLSASTGGAVTLGGTFDATKNFATAGLQPNTTYQFSITKGSGSTLSLLTGLTVVLGADGTMFANNTTGFGILGGLSVNLLTLFNTNDTATFTFVTPATITPNSTLNFDVTGQIGANSGLLGATTFSLTGAAIAPVAVPEPGTVASVVVGLGALAVWRTRRTALGA